MAPWDPSTLTEPQRKWFASVREGLERDTGRTLQAWVDIARTCPETRPRARLTWMKSMHGLGQNRASVVLADAFPEPPSPAGTGTDTLWADPVAHATFQAVAEAATRLDGVVIGPRKGYTAFSRRYQFAAARPAKGRVRLGLAVPPDLDARLSPRGRETWSERLASTAELGGPEAVDAGLSNLMRRAWEGS